jgi:nicotinate-nucleotide adenylyltransferase
MRRGLLGGTFDPIHKGHLALAEFAVRDLMLDELWLLPVGRPWMRPVAPMARGEDRVAMISLAIEGSDTLHLSRLEVDREGPTYTVETLEELQGLGFLTEEMIFIMGADALASVHLWKQPERILQLVRLAVARRSGYGPIDTRKLANLPPLETGRILEIDMPAVDVSGTEVRKDIAAGVDLRGRVPALVAEYIEAHGLYR